MVYISHGRIFSAFDIRLSVPGSCLLAALQVIFGAGSNFLVKWRIAGGVQFQFFRSFQLVSILFLFFGGDWALSYHSIGF